MARCHWPRRIRYLPTSLLKTSRIWNTLLGLKECCLSPRMNLDNSIVSNNWARVRYGIATVVSQPIKGFLMFQAPSRLQQVYVYVANSDSQIDLTKIPYKTALTPKMSQDHYGDLYPHFDKLRHYLGPFANSFYPFLGISVNTLGDAQATRGSPTTFLVGGGVDLGPYAGQKPGNLRLFPGQSRHYRSLRRFFL